MCRGVGLREREIEENKDGERGEGDGRGESPKKANYSEILTNIRFHYRDTFTFYASLYGEKENGLEEDNSGNQIFLVDYTNINTNSSCALFFFFKLLSRFTAESVCSFFLF